VIGEPTDLEGAAQLAAADAYQFQYWALGLVGARPHEKKKGADHGIDGQLRWIEDARGARSAHLIISVKSGQHISVAHIRDLVGTIEREKAVIGVYITLVEPTQPMRAEAASAGFYEWQGNKYPRIQILTVRELLGGAQIQYPAPLANVTFARAQRVVAERVEPVIPELERNPESKRRK
jgi:hypothetical protein